MKRTRRKQRKYVPRLVKKYKRSNKDYAADGEGSFRISSHAILRYLERAYGINVEAVEKSLLPNIFTEGEILRFLEDDYGIDIRSIKREMLPRDIQSAIHILGEGIYTYGDVRYIVDKKTVITTIKAKESADLLDITKHMKELDAKI